MRRIGKYVGACIVILLLIVSKRYRKKWLACKTSPSLMSFFRLLKL